MFKKIIEKLNKAEKVGIFTHENPDGDALGSSYSLKNVLEGMGKKAEVYIAGNIEPKLLKVIETGEESPLEVSECDLLVALDSADIQRLDKWQEVFKVHKNTIAIDHHITHREYAGITVVDDISATCEVMWKLYKEMGVKLSKIVATNLYIGITTDTGNFKYSSVTGDTHRVAADLIDCGIKFSDIAKILFDTVTKDYLSLKSLATEKIEYFSNDRIAILYLTDEEFNRFNVDEATASPLVVFPSSIEGVEVGIYIRQRGSNELKVSLRSVKYVDVSAIALKFGGGGHIRAAGYSIDMKEYKDNIKKLIAEIENQLN